MRRVAIVTGHFPPSNLAGVHRARLWAEHLPEFGWEPIVVTVHHRHYEEDRDYKLLEFVRKELEIIRTWAFPVLPFHLIGDIGLRGFIPMYAALTKLAREKKIEFVHITIPSNYCALLGRLIYKRCGIPYGIDFQDPWVSCGELSAKRLRKSGLSQNLAQFLEPWAVADARLITGISLPYFEDVLRRCPKLQDQAVIGEMPIGTAFRDFEMVRGNLSKPFRFDPEDGNCHIVYAGVFWRQAEAIIERIFEAISDLKQKSNPLVDRLRLHFIGTGRSPVTPEPMIIPIAERMGVIKHVDEHPARISYADVLNHLIQADGTLIIGSTEPHYSPSKVFQAVLAKKPVLAVLHEESSAVALLRSTKTSHVVTFSEGRLPEPSSIKQALITMLKSAGTPIPMIDESILEPYSARASARALAKALEVALDRFEA